MITINSKSHNDTKKIKRQRSYFWNKCEAIDNNQNSAEIGKNRDYHKQKKLDKNSYSTNNNHDELKSNIFSKFFRKVNSVFTSGQQQQKRSSVDKKKLKIEQTIKHSQSMNEIQHNNKHDYSDKRRSLFTKSDDNTMLSPLQQPTVMTITQLKNQQDKNELNDWKNTLLNELDATQYNINKYQQINNTDSNELVINTLQPSGMDNNRKVNQHFVEALDKKLGVISRKTMIDDWLHFNDSIPDSATSASYLQHYHVDKDALFTKKENITADNLESYSLLSKGLKKQGKMKHDHIREKLEIAAARRNAIKLERLREQMDTALFETIHMLRENNDNQQQQEKMLQQHNLEDWLFSSDKRISSYLTSNNNNATSSSEATSSLSTYNNNMHQNVPIW